MTPWQIELEVRWLKASNMRIMKRIEKEEKILSDIGEGDMLKVLIGEAPKGYKK